MGRALVLIDFQTGFDAPVWGLRNNPQAEARAAALLGRWRAVGAPIFHVRHIGTSAESPLTPAAGGIDFKPGLGPAGAEPVIEKSVNSAFIGTDLQARLVAAGAGTVVICGLTTPHCVSTTTRMAANLGFVVELAEDACAAFTTNADMGWRPGAVAPGAQAVHDMALAHLHGEFATVRDSREIRPGPA